MGGGSETLILEPIGADLFIPDITGGVARTITASKNDVQHIPAVLIPDEDGLVYIVRKLTPTECAALQGFPKDWASVVPHSDTAEYKMWGNGMALPCMLYIMEGIAEVMSNEEHRRDTEAEA